MRRVLALALLTGALTACQHGSTHCGMGVTAFLESSGTLDEIDHHYYDDVVAQMRMESDHIQNVKSSWDNQRGVDNKAAYVNATLVGDRDQSAEVVRNILSHSPPPTGPEKPGLTYHKSDNAYVIGPCETPEGEAAWERHLAGTAPGQSHVTTG